MTPRTKHFDSGLRGEDLHSQEGWIFGLVVAQCGALVRASDTVPVDARLATQGTRDRYVAAGAFAGFCPACLYPPQGRQSGPGIV